MKRNIVSFSGGKDSTAMLLMLLERGERVDDIVFCDTGMEFPEMYAHLEKVEAYTGRKVTRIKAEKGWDYWFSEYTRKKGKRAGEKGYGWPIMMCRWCTGHLKREVFAKYLKHAGEYVQLLGIAADEPKRLAEKPNTRYPLAEWGVTEKDALQYCKEHGFDWGGLYDIFPRVSCWICPLKSIASWRALRTARPELWERALQYDKASGVKINKRWTLHDLEARFQREDKTL